MEALTRKSNEPRRHHFLPASYLRNFCSEKGCLYVYERSKRPRQSTPKSEACIRDLYAYEDDNGKNFEIEQILGKYESAAAPIIKGMMERETKQRRLLNSKEIEILEHFAALTFERVPAGRRLDEEYIAPAVKKLLTDAAKDPIRFAEMTKDVPEYEEVSEGERSAVIEATRQRLLDGYYDEPEPPGFRLHAMLHVARMIADELKKYSCMVVVAPKHENFITGDTPVVTLTEEDGMTQLGTAFIGKNNTVWFPISSKLCLAWKKGIEPGYVRLPPRGVRMVNRNIMRFSERFIYGSIYSEKLRSDFDRIKQLIRLGENAFIPMWDGNPILVNE